MFSFTHFLNEIAQFCRKSIVSTFGTFGLPIGKILTDLIMLIIIKIIIKHGWSVYNTCSTFSHSTWQLVKIFEILGQKFQNYIFGITFLTSKVIFKTWNFVKMNPKFINRERSASTNPKLDYQTLFGLIFYDITKMN